MDPTAPSVVFGRGPGLCSSLRLPPPPTAFQSSPSFQRCLPHRRSGRATVGGGWGPQTPADTPYCVGLSLIRTEAPQELCPGPGNEQDTVCEVILVTPCCAPTAEDSANSLVLLRGGAMCSQVTRVYLEPFFSLPGPCVVFNFLKNIFKSLF